jgi:excisionase family DNA binding protein
MKKRIITISREFGSGGRFIGEEVAKKLGIAYYDKNIINKIAEKSGLSPEYIQENAELSPKKGLFAYAFAGRDVTGKSVEDLVYEAQRKVILELAEKESCVIIGRNADYILKDRDDVLNVFIHGDTPEKIQRIHNSNLYEIWRRENLETITVDSVKRIPVDVFERWYENQIMYQKADRMPTLTDLEADFIPLQEAAGLLGITKEKLSVITRASRYKDIFEIRVYDNKKWISKKSFQQFLNAQNVYQVIKGPEKEMPVSEESMETKEFISRQEAAALAGVTSATITKWVQLERFPCVGAGRVLRIYRKEFLQWLKEYREGGV